MQTAETITIRKGTGDDGRLLAALGRQTFHDSFAKGNRAEDMQVYLSESFSERKQASEIADPSSIFLIAEIGGEPVGYARLRFEMPPPCIQGHCPAHLQRIYASTQWIGRGVGPALMRFCIDEARVHHADGIWLGVWQKNDRAIRFYTKWGFSVVGSQHFQLGSDLQTDHVLWRPIPIGSEANRDLTAPGHGNRP